MATTELTLSYNEVEKCLTIVQVRKVPGAINPNIAVTVATSTAYFNGITPDTLAEALHNFGWTLPVLLPTLVVKQKPMSKKNASTIAMSSFGFDSASFGVMVRRVESFHGIIGTPIPDDTEALTTGNEYD